MPRRVQCNIITNLQNVRELKTEAASIEASHGVNPYSTYLRTHRKRPDPDQAAAIGRLLAGQVKASDGTMQPSLSAADRKALKEVRARRKAASRRYEQLISLQNAIAMLADIDDDPATLVGAGSCVLDGPAVVAKINSALSYLKQFAEYWNDRAHSQDQNGVGRSHKRNGS